VAVPSYTSLPQVPDGFEWTVESWGAALRCRPLAAVAPHLFTTRQLELSSAADVRALAEAVGARDAAMAAQVHGCNVVVIHTGQPIPVPRPEADALISDAPDIAIAVRVADCVPLLMADRTRGVVAAVHAGWRGTVARVAVAAVDALGRELTVETVKDGPFSEDKVWEQLRQCYDPEIPVNIVDLGLVYDMHVERQASGGHNVGVKMTLTAPGCGMGTVIAGDAQQKLLGLPGVKGADVEIVWDPPWHQSMITTEGRRILGLE